MTNCGGAAQGVEDMIDGALRVKYEALIESLSACMDMDAGLVECTTATKHGALVAGLTDELDLDAGLDAIASTVAKERTESTSPTTSPLDISPLHHDGGSSLRRPHGWSGATLAARLAVAGQRTRMGGNALLVPWRWRYELALGCGLPVLFNMISLVAHPAAAAAVFAAAAGVGVVSPAVRRWVVERAQGVVIQHRLRVGFVQAGIAGRGGRYPTILYTHLRSPRFIRVSVWCPAGVDAADFVAARTVLASACWAPAVEVVQRPRAAVVDLIVVLR